MASNRRGRTTRATRTQSEAANEQVADILGSFGEMASAMRNQAAATNRMVEELRRNTPGNQSGTSTNNQDRVETDHGYRKFGEFMKVNPPKFRGVYDPVKAEEWIKALEKVFSVIDCTEDQKVAFATYMLVADAEDWWSSTKQILESSGVPLNWDTFKTSFYEKYFPVTVRNAKELEFLRLQQGNMSVSEYIAKFEELSKFSMYFQRHPDEEWKCVKFEAGLNTRIQRAVGPFEIRNYAALVNKTRLVESYDEKSKLEGSVLVGQKRKAQDQGDRLRNADREYPRHQNQGRQFQPQKEACTKCGKFHEGQCLKGQQVCYGCGKPGHWIQDCRNINQQNTVRPQQPVDRPQRSGRVYKINVEGADDSK